MTFTPEIPTVPGAYWWKSTEASEPWPVEINGRLVVPNGGLWSPRLVPVDEVEKAYKEGYCDCDKAIGLDVPDERGCQYSLHRSRAKQIVEGKEQP